MKYNTKTSRSNKTENYASGEAFVESPKFALVSLLLTSFVSDQYYRSASESLADLVKFIDGISDKKFVAKAAIYARTKFGMRSISHAVAGEIAKKVKGEKWTKNFFNKIIYRPDDMMEILAYYYANNEKNNEPNALRKGFAKALERFDEYALSKYKKEGAEVSLIDVVNLVHPHSTVALKKLMKGTLKSPETWEVELTKAGQKAETEEEKEELKKDAWAKLIKEKKIGYFALLRNLRNIIQQAPELINDVIELLTNEKLIKKSLVLPFRFMTATKQLQQDGINNVAIYKAINEALEKSLANIPVFNGKTLVVVDHSGSMDSVEHGNLSNFELGALFGIALAKTNGADFMYFGDIAKYAGLNPVDSTPTLVEKLNNYNHAYNDGTKVGHGTNFHAIFETADKAYDRIIIFSDMQAWVNYNVPTSAYETYKSRTGAKGKIYSFDLAGYGSLQFPQENIYCLAGFSDKIFSIMELLEQDKNALITEIEQIDL